MYVVRACDTCDKKVFEVCCNDALHCEAAGYKWESCLTCYGILHVKMWGATTLARSLARVEPSDWLAISRFSSGP
jgi:hypothetical protein